MKRNEYCYIAIVVILGFSLLLDFATETFHLTMANANWMTHWLTSPIALSIGFIFALIFGKTFDAFNTLMSKKCFNTL